MLTTLLLSVPLSLGTVAVDTPAPDIAAARDTAAILPADFVVVPARIDLGTLDPGAKHTGEVWLINTSLDPVNLVTAKPTCGCTTVDFEPAALEAGAARRISFTIEAPKKPGESKVAALSFHADWGAPARLEIAIATAESMSEAAPAAVEPVETIAMYPVRSDLGSVSGGTSIDTAVWLVNRGTETTRVNQIKAGCGCTKVVGFEPMELEPGVARRVRLTITPRDEAKDNKTVRLTAVLDDDDASSTVVRMSVVPSADEVAAAE